MKNLACVIGVALFGVTASTGVMAACPVTYTFSNGTTADATQVNQDFADLTSCVAPLSNPNFLGAVGIGMTPSNVLDITKNQNAASIVEIQNSTHGATAGAYFQAANGTNIATVGLNSAASYTANGLFVSNRMMYYSNSTAGAALLDATGPIIFGAGGNIERARVGTDGSFLVGTATNGGWTGSSRFAVEGPGNGASFYTSGAAVSAYFRLDNAAGLLSSYHYGTAQVGFINTNGTSFALTAISTLSLNANSTVQVVAGGGGGVQLTSGATSWAAISDARLKNWGKVQTDYRSAIKAIDVGDYTWKATGKPDFGARAQQLYGALSNTPLQSVFVNKPKNPSDTWTVASDYYGKLALWGAKDLYKESSTQAARTASLESSAQALAVEFADLRHANDNQAIEIRELRTQVAALSRQMNLRTAAK